MVGLGLGALAAMAAVIVGTSHSVAQQGAPKAQPKAKPKAAPAPMREKRSTFCMYRVTKKNIE